MNRMRYLHLIVGLILSSLLLMACRNGAITSNDKQPLTPETTPTVAEATIQVPTSTPKATNTPLPTDIPLPTNTPLPPTNTPTAIGCTDDLAFVSDITIPDGTTIEASDSFIKARGIQNYGTCTWTTSYEFVFIKGEQMGAPASVPISQGVAPDGTIDISLTFTAPTVPGIHLSFWQLQAPDGTLFGLQLYVQIMVKDPNVPSEEEITLLATLKEEIFFSLGGGEGNLCSVEPPSGTASPTIGAEINPGLFSNICLWNFPTDEVATVELHAPNGDIYSDVFEIKYSYYPNLVSLPLWWPVSMPTGEWKIVASSASADAQEFMTIDNPVENFNIIPASGVDPFDLSHDDFFCEGSYEVGEQIEIRGVNYPPNKKLPLGIYTGGDPRIPADLVSSEIVTTDSQGNFQLSVSIETGQYYVVARTDPNEKEYGHGEFHCFSVR